LKTNDTASQPTPRTKQAIAFTSTRNVFKSWVAAATKITVQFSSTCIPHSTAASGYIRSIQRFPRSIHRKEVSETDEQSEETKRGMKTRIGGTVVDASVLTIPAEAVPNNCRSTYGSKSDCSPVLGKGQVYPSHIILSPSFQRDRCIILEGSISFAIAQSTLAYFMSPSHLDFACNRISEITTLHLVKNCAIQ
jgi:hypothetical protein